jgi:hypothetical protein
MTRRPLPRLKMARELDGWEAIVTNDGASGDGAKLKAQAPNLGLNQSA